MASDTGAKWVLLVFIYFVCLTIITTLISFSFGGTFDSDFGLVRTEQCSDPRLIYENYNLNPIYSTSDTMEDLRSSGALASISSNVYNVNVRDNAHLRCDKSIGVISNDTCLTINGCRWEEIPVNKVASVLNKFWNIWDSKAEIEKSCYGLINASYYDINTTQTFLSEPKVAKHNNSDLGLNMGSICTHPNIIYNSDLCEKFSCNWLTMKEITELEIKSLEVKASLSIFKSTINTISQMFTLRFDWGFENPFVNKMAIVFTFYIPLLILIFAIYIAVRS